MKTVRTIPTVLLDAQTGRTGIAAVKMQEFKFLGDRAVVLVAYYAQVERTNAQSGEAMYNLEPIPVKDSFGAINVKRKVLEGENMNSLFKTLGAEILNTDNFTPKFAEILTSATLTTLVADANFLKYDDGTVSALTIADWEEVPENEVVA